MPFASPPDPGKLPDWWPPSHRTSIPEMVAIWSDTFRRINIALATRFFAEHERLDIYGWRNLTSGG